MKVAFATLGCRVNIYESEAMIEKFTKDGYNVVDFDEEADVYVINTCTVTSMGDKKSRKHISRAKKKNPNAVVAVVGCYSQTSPLEVSSIEGVDVVLGTKNKGMIVYFANRAILEKKQFVEVNDVLKNNSFEELNISEFKDKTRAFLKIQDGCNKFCSFCLIPFARGAVCSKDPIKVIEEVKELAKHNFKEIILSGIHTASYGVDLEKSYDLLNLLEEIDEIKGIERVRIGSIDPTFFTSDTIDRMKNLKKLCPHFHLSLQSGCNDTLKRMNRRYTREEYKNILIEMREKIKDISITTDVIVGFPGETENEFIETYNFLKDISLSKMHIFKYSPRKGTKASEFKDSVHGNVKDERSKQLQNLDGLNEISFIKKFVGRKFEVLVEENINGEGFYQGYTPNYIKVMLKSNENISGKLVKVKLVGTGKDYALGEIIND